MFHARTLKKCTVNIQKINKSYKTFNLNGFKFFEKKNCKNMKIKLGLCVLNVRCVKNIKCFTFIT